MITLTFLPDATARCLYTDAIPLTELGTLRIRRASWIDWNEQTQQWEVRFGPHDDDAVFTSASREECLAWEREELGG